MVLFSSTVSYDLKSDKIWILFSDLVGNLEADPGEGPRRPGPPRYFWTKLRPERSKKIFKTAPPPPPLTKGLDDRPLPLFEGLDTPLQLLALQHYT